MKNILVLDGKKVAFEIECKLKEKVNDLKEKTGKVPTLATIVVGDNKASHTYVRMKGKACERIGINSIKIELDSTCTTEELVEIVENLNNDSSVNGVLIQHPLPRHIDERKCFDSIKLEKDVDGVTSCGFGAMSMGEKVFLSATPKGIIRLVDYYNIELKGKDVVVIGRSPILGKPLAMMLLNKDATVTITHSKTIGLEKIVKRADVVVACVGKANFVKKSWLKKGAVVIDAGYNEGGIGDVDLNNVISRVSAYTPVPGGVGPMTIAMLLEQTVEAFENMNV